MGRVGRQYSTFLSGFVVRIANTRFFSAPLSWRGDARAPPIATTQDFSAVLGVPRGTPGESSPSACGCGDDHGHPLPAGWFGCTAAGRFRIRQDRSRQPVCGAEGTTSPLSRNCFAGQRMGWDVWGDAWLAMGWNRLVGGLCISLWVPPCPFPSSFFLFEGWVSPPSKLRRVADAQSPRRWNDGWEASELEPWQPKPDMSAPQVCPLGERTCPIRVTAGRMGERYPTPPTDGKDFPL